MSGEPATTALLGHQPYIELKLIGKSTAFKNIKHNNIYKE